MQKNEACKLGNPATVSSIKIQASGFASYPFE